MAIRGCYRDASNEKCSPDFLRRFVGKATLSLESLGA